MSNFLLVEDIDRDALETELIRVTLDMIGRLGVRDVKVRDIAEAAGVSPTSIYNRFGSKDALILEALRAHHHNVINNEEWESAGSHQYLVDQAFDIGERYCRDSMLKPSFAAAVMSVHFNQDTRRDSDVVYMQCQLSFTEVLKQMRRQGELVTEVDLAFLATELADACHGMVFSWCTGLIPYDDFSPRMALRCATTLCPWVELPVASYLRLKIQRLHHQLGAAS